jgi:hypothetical protein
MTMLINRIQKIAMAMYQPALMNLSRFCSDDILIYTTAYPKQ